jgi:hypothetical protein
MIGQIVASARIIGLLGFPGHQTVLDVNLPATGAGAVHAVGRTHNLVVLPAGAVGVLPTSIFVGDDAMIPGEGVGSLLEKIQSVEKVTHLCLPRNL